ncbi:MAG: DUF1266 domain-containing protein [Gammaproteobacteria bacterium]|nr:DUF1266 domain-containing protein [Gammaproteobacteria bacterium]
MESDKAWMLTTGDVIFKYNTDVLCSLGSLMSKQAVIDDILKPSWDVSDKNTLHETLEWLLEGGHSAFYRNAFNEPKGKFQREFVEEFAGDINGRELKAWDLGRFVMVARWGHYAGFLTETQLWEQLRPVCQTLQQMYDSWEEYGYHYRLGRLFWRGEVEERYEAAFEFMMYHVKSPWQMLEWQTPLDGSGPAGQLYNPYILEWDAAGELSIAQKNDYYHILLQDDPYNPYACVHYADFLRDQMDDAETALGFYDRAMQIKPDMTDAYDNISAILWNDEERRDELQAVFEGWIEHDAENYRAFLDYAIWLAYELEDVDDAYYKYQRAMELAPESDTVFASYAEYLQDFMDEPELTLEMYHKALALNPDNQKAAQGLQSFLAESKE